ncbi:MAG: HAD hydrolase-like protein [Candidatus Micrarchaeia archaeon]
MKTSVPKAILFDIDDTLFPSSEFSSKARANAISAMICAGMGATPSSAQKVLQKIISKRGSNYAHHFDELVKEFVCKDSSHAVAAGIWAYHSTKSSIRPYIGTKNGLLKLKKRGYILCVASQGRVIKQWDKLIRLGLDSYFEHVFVTSKRKDRKFYTLISKKLKIPPSQILMVGDNPQTDILPAKCAGMQTARLMCGKHVRESGKAQIMLSSLGKLFSLL